MRIEAVDSEGHRVAVGRDLEELQQRFGGQARRRFMDSLGKATSAMGNSNGFFGICRCLYSSMTMMARTHGRGQPWSTSSLALTAGNQPGSICTATDFEIFLADVRARLGVVFRRQANDLDHALRLWAELCTSLDSDYGTIRPAVYLDMRSQLDDMVYDGFLQDLPSSRLAHYPRYLNAMLVRLQGVEKDPQRDAERLQQVEGFWQQYL